MNVFWNPPSKWLFWTKIKVYKWRLKSIFIKNTHTLMYVLKHILIFLTYFYASDKIFLLLLFKKDDGLQKEELTSRKELRKWIGSFPSHTRLQRMKKTFWLISLILAYLKPNHSAIASILIQLNPEKYNNHLQMST